MSSSTKEALCEFCKPLPMIGSKLEFVYSIPYYKTFEDLKASSLSGCILCTWILENVPYAISKIGRLAYHVGAERQCFQLEYFMTEDQKQRILEKAQQTPRPAIVQRFKLDMPDRTSMSFGAFYCNGRPPASKDGISGRRICVDPIEAISTVAIPWITNCERTHEVCRRSKQPPLPTRVLKVGDKGEDVVLMDSQGLEGPYVILSYCWGQAATLKTTPLTLAASQHGIPYEDLPLTLRHAVDFTRQLQVKYLWIDALCIIQEQDPPTDWLAESGKMLDYYRNAYVTIGNLDGETSSSGFLFPRKDSSVKIPGNEDIAIRLSPARRSSSIYFDSVLVTRAWCLQERLISTRLLLFGRDQMFWECRTCCESESDVVMSEGKLKYTGTIQGRQVEALDSEMVQVLASLGTGQMPLRDSMNIWYTIVQQYSSRQLTRATDILVAISGVANDIQRRTGYDYIYGHWKQDWCKGLVWSRRPRPDAQVTGAPSWCWASKTGKVVFKVIPTSEDNIFNTVFEDQIEFRETCYDKGELRVRAKCQQIDSRKILGRPMNESYIYVLNRGSGESIRNTIELDEYHDDLPKTTYKAMNTLLRCSYTVETNTDSELLLSGHFVLFYLVLVPEESSSGKWKRIGLGTCIQDITSRKISFEDLDCENIFQKLQLDPEELFDGCVYEDICLV